MRTLLEEPEDVSQKMQLHDTPPALKPVHSPTGVQAQQDVALAQQLRSSEARYQSLFNSIDDGFCVIEVLFDGNSKAFDYRFLEINPAFELQSGLVNALGKTMRDYVPHHDGQRFEIYGRVALTGEPIRFESRDELLDRWFDIYAFRVDEPGQNRVAVLFTNIADRKNAEAEREKLLQQLEAESSKLAYFFAHAPAFVATLHGPQHVFELTNPAYLRLIGHRDVVGKPIKEALPEIAAQGFVELLDNVFQTGEVYVGRETLVYLQWVPDGPLEKRYVDFVFQPIFQSDGTVEGIFVHGVDITAQVQARMEAEEARHSAEVARRNAEEANRTKDDFLATLSHELRTPLTAIMGWTNILQSGQVSAQELERGLSTIDRNVRAQVQLVEDILDVSRVITGKMRLEVQPVDLSIIVEEAVNTVLPAAQAKGVRLQRVLDAGASVVSGDPTRLQQVIWNLLSNAIKFTPRGGKVQILLERVNSHIEIVVTDTGQGIPSEVLPHVFDRFRQADSSSTRVHGGLGLGLSIVRHLIELHGGTVVASSEGLGMGATFKVDLPLLAVRSNPLAFGGERRVHPKGEGTKSTATAPRLDNLQVLVVDDQEDTRVLVTVILEKCGAKVKAVSSVPLAMAALHEMRPDVLVSDIGMPEEDGFSLIKRVRALPAELGGQTPAAALTAFARVEDRVKVLRSGFQSHLTKPIDPIELATVISTLAGRFDQN